MSIATAPNRITEGIEKMRVQIDQRIKDGLTTADALVKIHKTLDMDFEEHAKFQTLKSGVMGSLLTTDEAQVLYCYLGETPSVFNGQPVAVKAVLTQVFAELLKTHMAGRS